MLVLEWIAALRVATIVVVALKIIVVVLVHRIPLSSCALGRITLDLASGMTETHLSLLFS